MVIFFKYHSTIVIDHETLYVPEKLPAIGFNDAVSLQDD